MNHSGLAGVQLGPIQRAGIWLLEERNEDGGWGIYPGAPSKITNTAQSIIAIAGVDTLRDKIGPALELLRRTLTESTEQLAYSNTRHFALAAMAMMKGGVLPDDMLLQQCLSQLMRPETMHGGWGLRPNSRDFLIHPTSLALSTLSMVMQRGGYRDAVRYLDHGASWLIHSANEDGGWGFRPKDNNSRVACTAYALSSLLDAGWSTSEPVVLRGFEYIWQHQSNNGGWDTEREETTVERTFYWDHFALAQAILAISRCREYLHLENLYRALNRLFGLQNEDTGGWQFEDRSAQTIWATAEAMLTLDSYFDILSPESDVPRMIKNYVSISERANEYQSSLANRQGADFVFQLSPFGASINTAVFFALGTMFVAIAVLLLILQPLGLTSHLSALVVCLTILFGFFPYHWLTQRQHRSRAEAIGFTIGLLAFIGWLLQTLVR